MHSLNKIKFHKKDSDAMLDRIIDGKKDKRDDGSPNEEKKEMKTGRKAIKTAYQSYYANHAHLYDLKPAVDSKDKLGKALINTYQANPALIATLRRSYRENEQWCPYCSVNPIKHLDHYMPKGIYPEFALLDYNLVPSCSDCNTAKKELWDYHEYKIFNPFFHELPDVPILKARLDMAAKKDGVPEISFYIDETAGADPDVVNLVKSHCKKLNLITSETGIYVMKAVVYLSEALINLKKRYQRSRKRIDEEEAGRCLRYDLEEALETSVEQNGINHWESALLTALLELGDGIFEIFDALTYET